MLFCVGLNEHLQPNWNTNEETDAKDVEALVEEPESRDNYVSTEIPQKPILNERTILQSYCCSFMIN